MTLEEKKLKQILNGFSETLFLTKSGEVFNQETNQIIKPDKSHRFYLKTTDNKRKNINLKPLYRLVWGEEFCLDNIESLEGETWVYIPDTDNMYLISNFGRLKSLHGYEAKLLKPSITNQGYERLQIIINGEAISKFIHVLVCEAFLEPPKAYGYHIHHKDFNKLNNRATNLEYLSPQEHKKKHSSNKAEYTQTSLIEKN